MKCLLFDRIDSQAGHKLNELAQGKISVEMSDRSLKDPLQWDIFFAKYNYQGSLAIGIRGDSQINADSMEVLSDHGVSLIVRFGSGVNNIDVEAATNHGIIVENVAGQNANGVAELVYLQLFCLMRQLNRVIASQVTKITLAKSDLQGRELAEKTIGVIGTGYIGSLVIRKALGLGLSVMAAETDSDRQLADVDYYSVDEIMERADFITIHVPKTEENYNLIGLRQIQACGSHKPILINCARPGLVDLRAVECGLREGALSGYASDVDDAEDPVFKLDNTLVTPHIGAKTCESEVRCAIVGAQQIHSWLTQGQVSNGINVSEIKPRRKGQQRFVILNDDTPGAISAITSVVSEQGKNISFMQNAGGNKSNLAVTILDLDCLLSGKDLETVTANLVAAAQVKKVYVI